MSPTSTGRRPRGSSGRRRSGGARTACRRAPLAEVVALGDLRRRDQAEVGLARVDPGDRGRRSNPMLLPPTPPRARRRRRRVAAEPVARDERCPGPCPRDVDQAAGVSAGGAASTPSVSGDPLDLGGGKAAGSWSRRWSVENLLARVAEVARGRVCGRAGALAAQPRAARRARAVRGPPTRGSPSPLICTGRSTVMSVPTPVSGSRTFDWASSSPRGERGDGDHERRRRPRARARSGSCGRAGGGARRRCSGGRASGPFGSTADRGDRTGPRKSPRSRA